MERSGEDRGERDALGRRGTWFAQQLGEGWTEVEPGIYRFDAGSKSEADAGMAPPSQSAPERDLLEALNPVEGEPDPPDPSPADAFESQPSRRRFGRRTRT